MDKLRMQTTDLAEENYKKLAALFPNAVTETINSEGEVVRAIDADILRQEISAQVVDGKDERYQFTWPDKKKAVVLSNSQTSKTLRLNKTKSIGADGIEGRTDSENLYIEGDNLDALKILRETYLGKVKMIYIDPPYNTGSDALVYDDDSTMGEDEFADISGQRDDDGNILFEMKTNNESNGRFHTDWLNMIYPRLRIAKDIMKEDGVIFISIDDHEVENLKKVCDEVFGAQNFVAQLVWERAYSPKNDAKYISNSHDYVMMYAKNIDQFAIGRLPRTEEANARYSNPDNDPRGVWKASDMSVKTYSESCDYPITAPSGRVIEPPAGRCWSLSKNAFLERLNDNRIWFGPDGNGVPAIKRFLTDLKHDGMAPTSILFYKEVGHSQEGAQEVAKLLNGGFFSGPKPVRLMQRFLILANLQDDDIVVDFFSGSGSTAHAVMKKNAEEGKHIKFVLVQIPEKCKEGSEAYKAGFRTICDIGEERIKNAGIRIKDETHADIDYGFKVFHIDESNMKDVYYNPAETRQMQLDMLSSNIKEDRTAEDLLFQTMLELGVMPSSKIEERLMGNRMVFDVADGFLIACFDKNITEETIKAIALRKPYYAVFRDEGMANDSVATNFDQIFETYSKDTIRKIL